jgi:hypothetical protein
LAETPLIDRTLTDTKNSVSQTILGLGFIFFGAFFLQEMSFIDHFCQSQGQPFSQLDAFI